MGNTKNGWNWGGGGVLRKILNIFSKINFINNTMTRPHINVNGDGIYDSGNTIHYYHRDTATDNGCPAAALHSLQRYVSQIMSTLQAYMKVSTLNKDACREYKFTTLTPNLVSLPVLIEGGYTFT